MEQSQPSPEASSQPDYQELLDEVRAAETPDDLAVAKAKHTNLGYNRVQPDGVIIPQGEQGAELADLVADRGQKMKDYYQSTHRTPGEKKSAATNERRVADQSFGDLDDAAQQYAANERSGQHIVERQGVQRAVVNEDDDIIEHEQTRSK